MLLLESVYYLVVSYFFVFQDITVFPDVGLSPGLCRLSALFLVPHPAEVQLEIITRG